MSNLLMVVLICEYVFLFVVAICEARTWLAVYWLGAVILNVAVLKGLK